MTALCKPCSDAGVTAVATHYQRSTDTDLCDEHAAEALEGRTSLVSAYDWSVLEGLVAKYGSQVVSTVVAKLRADEGPEPPLAATPSPAHSLRRSR